MQPASIAELLSPFIRLDTLNSRPLREISTYLDLLLRWNARINLTAVGDEERIVTRHFGESLFAARHLFPTTLANDQRPTTNDDRPRTNDHRPAPGLLDLGSGAGFPGLPIKIWAPHLRVTLIESNHKKATFLREVIRALKLTDIDVFAGRAEQFPGMAATVTLRAVERFESVLPIATRLVAPSGRLALLIGQAQVAVTSRIAREFLWDRPIPIPLSQSRVILLGTRRDEPR